LFFPFPSIFRIPLQPLSSTQPPAQGDSDSPLILEVGVFSFPRIAFEQEAVSSDFQGPKAAYHKTFLFPAFSRVRRTSLPSLGFPDKIFPDFSGTFQCDAVFLASSSLFPATIFLLQVPRFFIEDNRRSTLPHQSLPTSVVPLFSTYFFLPFTIPLPMSL